MWILETVVFDVECGGDDSRLYDELTGTSAVSCFSFRYVTRQEGTCVLSAELTFFVFVRSVIFAKI